ncbi:hypothetical protein [Rickettsia amblyommatis]|uniref:hypothetical protein n=1 Tax=Rickettsia amblyommatis TaxID=33989 RepID=UPI00031C258A|nr:hypothetical protein [Rickettsia amblyommatis]KJV88706.1 hypothetical protein RAMDARK_1643 [Rickettsia amblyommatis str. Darkwater]
MNSELGAVKIDGNMNFRNNAGTAIFASDVANNITSAITGNITSTGGTNGTVEFMDNGTIGTVDGNGNSTNTITNLAMLKAGADNSTVTINAGSNMSIAEIQGTGTGNIVFTQATNLTGGINITGGKAVDLMFTGPSSVSGAIGSGASKVGDITISGDVLNCTGGINAGYVMLINGGNIKFNGTTNSLDISEGSGFSPFALAINPEDSVVIFDESTAMTYSGSIGTKEMVDIVQIDGGDVTNSRYRENRLDFIYYCSVCNFKP